MMAWRPRGYLTGPDGQVLTSRTLHNFNYVWFHLDSLFPDLQPNPWLNFTFMSCYWYSRPVSIHCWSLKCIDFNLPQQCSRNSLVFILCWNPLSVKEKIVSISEFQKDTVTYILSYLLQSPLLRAVKTTSINAGCINRRWLPRSWKEVIYVSHNLGEYGSQCWESDFEKNVNKMKYEKIGGLKGLEVLYTSNAEGHRFWQLLGKVRFSSLTT